ncbi:26S proteasome non-ATPase regulatory subunit [Wickerhamomyces ciferrii]|uniref:26S proteasome non-ATPase regulatory subunit n=1 Tax=Wickerhamomyces ciferrii (strain ATCC 14091 / BCRC 22168 / CBS 111 / JCM 3599 / NBRC 0793 / NRRL Y-1031 F-60-10) TaxID=1206466 RepID=K0KLS8_WICCF|nr:26S proteasome non-ATPase regulatory subunit [Wickerhamomyces ciferrii]CCH42279.1 26S proteasome non-ATPase regulatory subunit [Wickerhamomyces ciferrii]
MTVPTLEDARAAVKQGNEVKAEQLYQQIIQSKPTTHDFSNQETAIFELGNLYKDEQAIEKLTNFIPEARSVISSFAKSKAAKTIRYLIDLYDKIPNSTEAQIAALKDSIEWSVKEKRSFLNQSLRLRLANVHYEKKQEYQAALAIINALLREFKKLDDKPSLVEVQLLEAKVYHSLRNLAKARAALTSARTSANAIYCPTLTQAELDNMSGILHAEDKDYKTAYSYFYEAFESYNTQDDEKNSIKVLKYMLLSKIMLNLINDVKQIMTSKYASKYVSKEIDAMKAISQAYDNRSLKEFEQALVVYGKELSSDPIIKSHFNALYDQLLEQNLVKLIEPFSVVEVNHISKMIGLDIKQVEGKLSQMILDEVFYGVLDQGNGWLYIYDKPKVDATYDSSLELINHMSNVVELLYEKAATLN